MLVEERDGRGLDADRRPAAHRPVRHGVQVVVEDPGLRVLVLELGRQLRLADLAREVALRVLDVEGADELLGDRRAALDRLAGFEVLDPGADDRVEVHPVVLVEALVLDRDGRAAHVHGDVLPRDDPAQHVGLDEAEPRAVDRVDHRELALVGRLQLGEVGRRGRDREHVARRGEHADDGDGGDDPEAEQHRVAPGMAPSPSRLSLPLSHWKVRRRTARQASVEDSACSRSKRSQRARSSAAALPRSAGLVAQVVALRRTPSLSVSATDTEMSAVPVLDQLHGLVEVGIRRQPDRHLHLHARVRGSCGSEPSSARAARSGRSGGGRRRGGCRCR